MRVKYKWRFGKRNNQNGKKFTRLNSRCLVSILINQERETAKPLKNSFDITDSMISQIVFNSIISNFFNIFFLHSLRVLIMSVVLLISYKLLQIWNLLLLLQVDSSRRTHLLWLITTYLVLLTQASPWNEEKYVPVLNPWTCTLYTGKKLLLE